MKQKLLEILVCPDCRSALLADEESFTCSSCKRNFPIVNGIVIFLALQQSADFFQREETGKYLEKSMAREILKSKDFLQGFKKIVEHVSSGEFQKNYEAKTCQWEGDLNNEEAEKANKKSTDVLAEKARVYRAETILDWPTGKGCFLRTILDKVKNDSWIVCLDIDFIELASLKAFLERKEKSNNVLFVNADARKMPFKDQFFDAVTAWGGFIEVPDVFQAIKESWRVLKPNSWFAGDGEIYKENSESMKVADSLGIGHLATKERIQKCLRKASFKDTFFETLYEGRDQTRPGPDQAPLPAYGDWFGLVVAGGQK